MTPAPPPRLLRELGRTEGGTDALGLLVRDQDTRRLILLRAVLDAAEAAPASVCPPSLLDRLRADWALLERAERSGRHAVRTVLFHPMTGPWAQRLLAGLTGADAPGPVPRTDLGHLTALAVAAAVRAGEPCTVRIEPRDGLAVLPTLGAVRTGSGPVALTHTEGRITIRPTDGPPLAARTQPDSTVTSADPRWIPLPALSALLPGTGTVLLDDLDPYRGRTGALPRQGLGGVVRTDDQERKAWAACWAGVDHALRAGGEHRLTEAAVLLRCLVPLGHPPGSGDGGTASCSGTRREAFGAVLSSRPPTPAHFAATLVHELQHTKLSALTTLVPLHHEDAAPRHFAPWRPDPRPFDGLLQGAYSHLALADYWQRLACGDRRLISRDQAWAEHARCREQVGAVLPALAGSARLTPEGRLLVNEMITLYHRMDDCPPPAGHLARAKAYVSTVRVIWQQRNGSRRRERPPR
ncbi:HEXXH motif domain-containing protein [Streptomyces sp. NPDC001478]